jgi:hypothetical protein
MYSQDVQISIQPHDNKRNISSRISSIAHELIAMAETESKDRIPTGPQFSEAVASFLYDSLNDATKSLVVRLKNPESKPGRDEDHTPPGSETESDSPLSLFNVPHSRNKNFCGRSEALKELFAMWKPKAQNRIAVVGLGGIG